MAVGYLHTVGQAQKLVEDGPSHESPDENLTRMFLLTKMVPQTLLTLLAFVFGGLLALAFLLS